MIKKYVLPIAVAGFLATASIVEAPITSRKFFGFQRPKMEISIESPLEKYAKELEEEFLKASYKKFPYSQEIPKIVEHARITGLEPELLMAIRLAENGKDSVAYGIMPGWKIIQKYQNDKGYTNNGRFYLYQDEKEKQLHWAAKTVRYYKNEFNKNLKNKDFISYLAKRYAPIGALNDPKGLNRNWERNVKRYYKTLKK